MMISKPLLALVSSLVPSVAALDSTGASEPLPAMMPEPPSQGISAPVIVAAVLGSLIFVLVFLWFMKRGFGDSILRSELGVRRRGRSSGYLLPIGTSAIPRGTTE